MTRRQLYLLLGTVSLVLCIVCLILFLPDRGPQKPLVVRQATTQVAERGSVRTEAYESPIDFQALQELNEDIYAWLYIPGSEINHPVLQSSNGDYDYYLTHTVDRIEDENGCLFTEYQYNGKDFTDPVTVIYGHQMRGESYFGKLQQYYSDAKTFKKYKKVEIYLPDRTLKYEVFAALPYSNRHILSFYNKFKYYSSLSSFLDTVYNARDFGVNIDQSVEIGENDRILILSTCLKGDNTRRFLVLARLVGEIKY